MLLQDIVGKPQEEEFLLGRGLKELLEPYASDLQTIAVGVSRVSGRFIRPPMHARCQPLPRDRGGKVLLARHVARLATGNQHVLSPA